MEQVKCCGVCRFHVRDIGDDADPRGGSCTAPLPVALYDSSRHWMRDDKGTDCPCFEPKREG